MLERARPTRSRLVLQPRSPLAAYRFRHVITVGRDTPTFAAIAVFASPSAATSHGPTCPGRGHHRVAFTEAVGRGGRPGLAGEQGGGQGAEEQVRPEGHLGASAVGSGCQDDDGDDPGRGQPEGQGGQ